MNAPRMAAIRTAIQRSHTVGPVLLAVSVGLLAATWAILFRWLIALAGTLFFDLGADLTGLLPGGEPIHRLHLLLAPALGMVLVVLIVRTWAPEARGHGVPEVQHAVRHKGGRMRARVVLVKAVASAISIGSGGSVGREGPIVQVGSSLGSSVGQLLGLGPEQVKLLVACGAAGGIAATFNAPLGGVLFALEVILGSFAARSFGLVVISAVSATALSGAVLGHAPAFQLAHGFSLISQREFILYPLLGGILGLTAVAYIRSVYRIEALFDAWAAHPLWKGLAGGLALGAIGFFGSPLLFGVGYEGVDLALAGQLSLSMLLLLAVLKVLATSLTLGAGGSGGVFAPALFIGAMVGGAFGLAVNGLFPDWTAPAGAYALVGMAGVFGASAHAPVTAVLILFEMTDNYQIILPLMATVGLSYLVASSAYGESIYSLKLKRLGGDSGAGRAESVLDLLLVADAMAEDVETVSPLMTVEELLALARRRRTRSWPVIDDEGGLLGIVTETDLERALISGGDSSMPVERVMTTSVITLRPQDTLRRAYRLFSEWDIKQIPVVEGEGEGRVTGALKRYDMLWAFKTVSEEHDRLLDARQLADPLAAEGVVQMQIAVHRRGSTLAGRHLRDLAVPEGALVSLIRRSGRAFVPRGDVLIQPGDVLILVTTPDRQAAVDEWIQAAGRSPKR